MTRLATMTQAEFNDLKLLFDNLDDALDEVLGGVGCLRADDGMCDGDNSCGNCAIDEATSGLRRLINKIARRNKKAVRR